jgi:hypothetical protein
VPATGVAEVTTGVAVPPTGAIVYVNVPGTELPKKVAVAFNTLVRFVFTMIENDDAQLMAG